MKPITLPLLAVTFALTLPGLAAEKGAAPSGKEALAAKADALGDFKTADDLWKHIEKLREEPKVQPKTREEFLSIVTKWFGDQRTAAEAFLQRFPEDKNRYAARLISLQATMQLGRIPGASSGPRPDFEKIRGQIAEIIAAADAPEDVKGEATFIQAISFTENPDPAAFLKASDEFLSKYGTHKLAMQMRQAQLQIASQSTSPEAVAILEKIAAGGDAQLAPRARLQLDKAKKMAELKTKPVGLKFTATDGKEVDLEKLRGKVVLVDFWASWCGPCISEMPNVVAAYQKLHEKGFEVVGISLDQDKTAMEASMKKLGMTWQQYFDGKGWENTISTSFGITSIPATWLVDKKGMLRETNLRGEALATGVEKLLAE